MERASRAELLSTINGQRDQLQHYKAKLRDVVSAYKSITKEKEALEASVAVLNASGPSNNEAVQSEQKDSEQSEQEETDDELSSLRKQVKTLSSSLTTLTQEKNKIEANFIADKKQMKHEIEDLHLQLDDEKERSSSLAEGFETQITNIKSQLRTHQLEREKEQTNHGFMLKELQTLLTTEKMCKEQVMSELEESRKQLKDSEEKMRKTPLICEVHERQIDELQKELTSLRQAINAAEVKSNQPSPFVLELKQEIERTRETHQRQVAQEQMKRSESEFKLQSQSKQNEERVSCLEAKLSDLSQTLGNYERLRFQDQQSISKLKERVTQLDLENTALLHAANLAYGKPEAQEESLSVDKIMDKIMHLRDLLITALEKSDTPVKMSSIFVKDLNKSDEESATCKQYKNELEKVKEDFERYKLRAQSILKTKTKDNSASETELLKEQNVELRNKLRICSAHYQEEIAQLQTKVDNLSKALLAQDDKMKMELLQVKASQQKEIGQFELELKKQRERTVSLLSEKDHEIQRMMENRGIDPRHYSNIGLSHISANAGKDQPNNESEELQAVNKLLNLPKDIESEAALLHFSQEKARTDVEIATLRKQKRELETTVRENHALAMQKERQLRDEINVLKESDAETKRQSGREGANLEYLKNVLLKFLISTDRDGKMRMLKALMTILQFSPQESQKVEQGYSKTWWTS